MNVCFDVAEEGPIFQHVIYNRCILEGWAFPSVGNLGVLALREGDRQIVQGS